MVKMLHIEAAKIHLSCHAWSGECVGVMIIPSNAEVETHWFADVTTDDMLQCTFGLA